MESSSTQDVYNAPTTPSASTVVCTIISKNYLAAARTLMSSIREFHDDLHCVVLLVDAFEHYPPEDEPFEFILAEDLGIPKWEHFSMKYDLMELNTAVKPYLMEALFDRFNAEKVIYFDPDIVVYRRLNELLGLLDDHMIVLTPHILAPLNDDYSPGELTFLQVGTFNLGFIAMSRQPQWRQVLQWWQDKLYNNCTREIERGMFVDQHWADLMPCLFENVHVLRNPGYNVAYWNFKTRDLQPGADGYAVDGHPLVFFHFSGFSYDDYSNVSKHQNRFVLSDLNEHYHACFKDYHERLKQNGYESTRKLPYAYGYFSDGVPVSDILRVCLRTHDLDGDRWPNPYDTEAAGNFRDWATRPPKGSYISPYAVSLYLLRPEIRDIYPDIRGKDHVAYATWFTQQEVTASPFFHPFYIRPIKEALKAGSISAKATPPAAQMVAETVTVTETLLQVTEVHTVRPPLKGRRLPDTLSYYQRFPVAVKPYLPANVMDASPAIYTGPSGFYGSIRKTLLKLNILQTVRRMVGLRLIMSARFFFSYPAMLPLMVEAPHAMPVLHNPIPAPNVFVPADAPLVAEQPAPAAPVTSTRPALTRGVNVVGYVRSETGIGQIARNLLKCLETVDFPAAVQVVETYDPARKEDRAADRFPQGTPHKINVFQVNADMTFPVRDLLDPSVYANHYNIGYWAWELSAFPEMWQPCFDVYNEIWVFSSFAQVAISARSPLPVVRVPVSIEVPFSQASRTDLGLPEDSFIALFVFDAGSIIERKNPWAAIKAFEMAFTPEERQHKARLVMKINNLASFPDDARRVREEMQRINGILLEDYLDRPDVNALLNHCDVYLSLHRSEGYGLTLAEAMYLGKPVIGTAYSGNTDFMNLNNSYPAPYQLVELTRDYPPYMTGNVWADPDVEAAARLLRHVYENPDDARRKGQAAANYMRRHHNQQAVGETIAARLNYILDKRIHPSAGI